MANAMLRLLILESFLLYSVVVCVACAEPSLRLCGSNEEYAKCVDNCRTCAYRGNCMQTAECRPGCHCINGYFRNNQGNCVPEAFCEQTCGPNQDYSECGSSCPDTCDNYGIPRYCTLQCIKGCFCRKGLVRNNYGVCVIPERCGKTKCNADELFQNCGTSCPDTCDNYNKPRPCTYECVAGCFCKPGLVRDRYFKCIEPKKCETVPGRCGKDETFYNCTPSCKNTCKHYNNPGIRCACGPPGCYCKEGMVKDEASGKCVRPQDCPGSPKETCGPNQDYSECGTSCPDTCGNYGIPRYCTKQCAKGCFCRKGFVRNDYGECVIPEMCGKTKCSTDEAFQSCGASCPDTCENYGKPRPCTYECVAGCFCKPGLVRDSSNFKCIEPEKCVKVPGRCGRDQTFYDCTPSCKNTCRNYNNPGIRCGCGPPGCYCKEGLVKDEESGKCVRPQYCPGSPPGECKADEEFYGNMPDCKNTCENYNNPGALCHVGKAGCFCKRGLVKRKDGRCVHPEHCDKGTEICGVNEDVVYCAKPKWCNTCDIRGNCKLTRCESGCDCKRGYYRNQNGVCIDGKFCPGNEYCGPNEEYRKCGSACPPTCENIHNTNVVCPAVCREGCFCKSGYIRNKESMCIPVELCPRTGNCGPNEEYTTCGSACPPTCDNVNNTDVYCPAVCTEGCFCKNGFIRNRERACIPVELCPEYCGPNEEYRKCGSACPPTCENIHNTNVVCPAVCREGCFCKSGYIRNKESMCIPVELCPRTGKCGLNEEYTTCGSACPPTCDNINNTNVVCPAVCREGCFCKEGYIRNRERMCIPVEMCPTQECGENEIFSTCAVPCNDCKIKGNCFFLLCNKGCDCVKGHYRNENGICIPEYQCPISGY